MIRVPFPRTDPVGFNGWLKWKNSNLSYNDIMLLRHLAESASEIEQKIVYKPRICGMCRRSGTIIKRCGTCNELYYCSEECKEKHWRKHWRKCLFV